MGEARHSKTWQKLGAALAIGAAAAVAASALSRLPLFKFWELKTYDLRMQLVARAHPEPQHVVLFTVDEDSLRFMQGNGVGWPWPRELYASALDFCRRGGARAVLFDLFFSEESVYGVDDDESFAAGLKAGPPSFLVLFLSGEERTPDPREPSILEKNRILFEGAAPPWMIEGRSLQSLPIAPLANAAAGFGNAQIAPDDDGIYRRLPLLSRLRDVPIPAIPLKVSAWASGEGEIAWPERSRLLLGRTPVPLDGSGEMLINYYGGADTFPHYSLAQVLAANAALASGGPSDLDPAIVRDKIVVVGLAAPGLYDLKPTPLARTFPGPEVHATVIENLLTGDFIAPLPAWAGWLGALAAGVAAAAGLAFIPSAWGIGTWVAALALSLIGACLALFWRGVAAPMVPPLAAFSLAAFGMTLRNYLAEGRRKREIRRAFSQYLSPEVVGIIARDPSALKLGGIEQEITIFFSDIADFTSISERTPPARMVGRLNAYFSLVTRIIQAEGGTLDKYIGDAVMAFWGAPLVTPDHAARAARAALEIQQRIGAAGLFATRVGIHTGSAVVGNIGSDVRFNYTAIGDAVNLASRLEGLCKQFGTRIIISEATLRAAEGAIEARRIGRVRVKGRAEPIGIYEPLRAAAHPSSAPSADDIAFNRALELFEAACFIEARGMFERLATRDPVSRAYLVLCEEHQAGGGETFDGVITFTTK